MVGAKETNEELEDRGLAGAVAADDAEHLAFADFEIHVVQDHFGAELDRHFVDVCDDRSVGLHG